MAGKREKWTPLLCNYPNSEKINSVSFEAETLYTRLIASCDDNANYDGTPTLIMCGLYAKRFEYGQIDVPKAEQMRNELVTAGLITLYQSGGKTYLHVNNCKKSLRDDINRDYRFPEFTQTVENKELPVHVTKPLRKRNEPVTETLSQSNPIQSNPTTDTTTITKEKIDFKNPLSFELPLQKLALESGDRLEKILPPKTDRERKTFVKLIQHITAYCRDGRSDRSGKIFDDFISLAKTAAASNAGSKKAFFVSMVKKKYGFNNGGSHG